MNGKRLLLPLLILLAGLLLSACGGALVASNWPGLLVNDDTAYLAYNNFVYAIDLADGTPRWRFPAEADRSMTFYAKPSLTPDGQLIIGDYTDTLHRIDADTGREVAGVGRWPFRGSRGRFVGGALSTETGIYAPAADGLLFALDADANPLWGPFETDQPQWAQPATDGERLYLPSLDHLVYALDPTNGSVIWSQDLGGAVVGTPALSEDGNLYVGSFSRKVAALDADTGAILWEFSTEGWVWSAPALDGDRLYFGDLNGFMYAIDRANGTQIWRQQADGLIAGTPLVTEEAVYFATEAGSVIALDKAGSSLWSQQFTGKIYSAPAAAGDLILVPITENDSPLIALNNSGAQVWAFTPEE